MPNRKYADLDINENERLQRITWVAQRVAWVVMSLLVAGALAGALGRGPLASARAGDPASPPWIQFECLAQSHATTRLVVHLARGPGTDARVVLGAEYLDEVAIESIVPEPDRVLTHDDGMEFVFPVADVPGAPAVLRVRPERAGRLTGRISQNGKHVAFRQWVYP